MENTCVRLLKDLAYQNEASGADAILDNFRCAALSLSYVLSLPPLEKTLPELPDDLSDLRANLL